MKNLVPLFTQIVSMQFKLNDKIGKEWLIKPNNNLRAVFIECAELMDSTAWKWWKHQEMDKENIKVELIDIFHFLISAISCDVYHSSDDYKNMSEKDFIEHLGVYLHNLVFKVYNKSQDMDFFDALNDVEMGVSDSLDKERSEEIIENSREMFRVCVESLASICVAEGVRSSQKAVESWANLWVLMGFTLEDLYKEYMVKNILNGFRQDHGYKDGTYITNWSLTEGTKCEDNVFAFGISKTMDVNEEFPIHLTRMLDSHYKLLEDKSA